MLNDKSTLYNDNIRKSNATVSSWRKNFRKYPNVDAFLLYNGAPEAYEDPADYVRIRTVKGTVIA